jgi:hypothetical protein
MQSNWKKSLLAMAAALAFAPWAQAITTSPADYKAGKTRISADYKTDKAACGSLKANAKDICVQEAKAKEKLAFAELEFAYTGKAADGTKVEVVKADGSYAVAKEKCDDLKGNDKDVCVKEAKAVHVKALADAKVPKKVAEVRSDAAADVNTANYKVAVEKCDSMTGDAKTACVAAAKTKFGKS